MSDVYCPDCQTQLSHRTARLPVVRGRHLECAVGSWLNDRVREHGTFGFPLRAAGTLFVLSFYLSLARPVVLRSRNMTVIDMEEARQRLEDKMLQRMHATIQGEVGKAAAAGMPWTPYRPFHCDLEAVGARLCGSCLGRGRSRTRARRASFVSYSTLMAGRVSTCTWCHAGLGEIADNLTLNMMEALVDAFDDEGRQVSKIHGTVRAALRRRFLFDGDGLTESGLVARKIVREGAAVL